MRELPPGYPEDDGLGAARGCLWTVLGMLVTLAMLALGIHLIGNGFEHLLFP